MYAIRSYYESLAVFLLPAALLVAIFLFARVPASYFFSALRPMRWLLVFMFVINLFATKGENVLFAWKFIRLTREALEQASFMTLRLILLVAGTSILTLTTRITSYNVCYTKLLRDCP